MSAQLSRVVPTPRKLPGSRRGCRRQSCRLHGPAKVVSASDVVAVKHAAGPVARNRHGDCLGHTPADHVPDRGSPEVVEQFCLEPCARCSFGTLCGRGCAKGKSCFMLSTLESRGVGTTLTHFGVHAPKWLVGTLRRLRQPSLTTRARRRRIPITESTLSAAPMAPIIQ